MYKAKIDVTLKKSVFDPQGETVLHALHSMDFKKVKTMRVGRYFELTLDVPDEAAAQKQIAAMCDRLLVNPVIEEYSFSTEQL